MIRTDPRVSIGLPVYNGERYLSEAIESLLNQTFHDFEIIICDNASDDRTEAICRSYASRDQRIRYHRNGKNIGASANFNLSFRLATGKYFKWAAHDDLHGREFLLQCVEILDEDPRVVLCHTDVQYINEHGENIENPPAPLPDASSPIPHIRFAQLISMRHWCLDIFGVIRKDVLSRTPLISDYVGSDRNTLVTLALLGRFQRLPERLFFTRDHGKRSVRRIPLHLRRGWFNPNRKYCISLPHWRIWFEYVKTLWDAHISHREKGLCVRYLMSWLYQNHGLLKKDCRMGAKQLLINMGIDYSRRRFWKGSQS